MAIPGPLDTALTQLAGAARMTGGFIVVAAAIYLPGRFLVLPLVRTLADVSGLNDDLKGPIVKVSHALVALIAFYMATALSGVGSVFTATEAITAAATIALGFAAQDVLGNFVSGVFIVTDPRFNIGDWIQWDDKEGIVEDISFRVTRVHTFDNELITVPNAELTKNAVINPVAKDRLRVSLVYGIAYDADLDLARSILVEEAQSIENVIERPPPTVSVSELAPSAIEVTARFWISEPEHTDFVRIRSQFHNAVLDRFDEAGIEMPYPRQEISGGLTVREPGSDLS